MDEPSLIPYSSGDRITYRLFEDVLRTVRVTERRLIVSLPGAKLRPGFFGVLEEHTGADEAKRGSVVFGYDDQVVGNLTARPAPTPELFNIRELVRGRLAAESPKPATGPAAELAS